MGNAVIFSGSNVRTLKPGIRLSTNATIWSGNIDPSVTGYPANQGDLYISTLTENTYTKIGPTDTEWRKDNTSSSGDIPETSFTAADNQVAAANVTGFAFANASIRAFKAVVSVTRGATYEVFELMAVQRAADWSLDQSFVGDVTGLTFSITTAGQIQYTSTSTGSTALVKFRAEVLSV